MKHTPPPYRYEVYEIGCRLKRAYLIEEKTADVFASGLFVDDAAFIVEACNAYERLKDERDAALESVKVLVKANDRIVIERDALLKTMREICSLNTYNNMHHFTPESAKKHLIWMLRKIKDALVLREREAIALREKKGVAWHSLMSFSQASLCHF